MPKTLRKTINITQLVDSGSFGYQIQNLDFQPDELILRGFTISDLGSVDEHFILSSDIINNNVLLAFGRGVLGPDPAVPGGSASNPFNYVGSKFTLTKEIRGQYNFTITNAAGNPPAIDMILSLQLEFVKYL